jgi:hypothetical protein
MADWVFVSGGLAGFTLVCVVLLAVLDPDAVRKGLRRGLDGRRPDSTIDQRQVH